MENNFNEDCIFCKIIKGDIQAKIIKENDYALCFADVNPKAKTHVLVVPKKHINNLTLLDNDTMGHILDMIKSVAVDLNIEHSGFRVINNCGAGAGQTVMHVHFHVLSGKLSKF